MLYYLQKTLGLATSILLMMISVLLYLEDNPSKSDTISGEVISQELTSIGDLYTYTIKVKGINEMLIIDFKHSGDYRIINDIVNNGRTYIFKLAPNDLPFRRNRTVLEVQKPCGYIYEGKSELNQKSYIKIKGTVSEKYYVTDDTVSNKLGDCYLCFTIKEKKEILSIFLGHDISEKELMSKDYLTNTGESLTFFLEPKLINDYLGERYNVVKIYSDTTNIFKYSLDSKAIILYITLGLIGIACLFIFIKY